MSSPVPALVLTFQIIESFFSLQHWTGKTPVLHVEYTAVPGLRLAEDWCL